jgi:hypothetical protein
MQRLVSGIALMAAGLSTPVPGLAGERGIGISARTDLDDSSSGDAHLRLRPGPSIRVPLRWGLGHGVYVRSTVDLGVNPAQDRVEWKRLNGALTVYSDEHWTLFSSASLTGGPELALVESEKARVLWGVSVGFLSAQMWHSFDSRALDLFDLDKNDLSNSMNIDPYTNQIAALVGTHGNFTVWRAAELAIELEVGYNVSFLREVSLRKAEEEVEAVRSAMGLNLFCLGVSFIQGKGSGAEQ